ncbi:hypothetical protein N7539_006439 [Penicillium diatomitis]|uniref:Uncharacterized protein n=1 Tax=Penicillium diatomitis TaxID=2819901 RepID=A0A9X0BSV5_9EURO|nr:uncharacterized protein N7539_006439 [Penicillium diatomitis]KAJ5482993.1 hypothetical protein N7539_006439 [Penicillium diatomitis]
MIGSSAELRNGAMWMPIGPYEGWRAPGGLELDTMQYNHNNVPTPPPAGDSMREILLCNTIGFETSSANGKWLDEMCSDHHLREAHASTTHHGTTTLQGTICSASLILRSDFAGVLRLGPCMCVHRAEATVRTFDEKSHYNDSVELLVGLLSICLLSVDLTPVTALLVSSRQRVNTLPGESDMHHPFMLSERRQAEALAKFPDKVKLELSNLRLPDQLRVTT